MSATTAKIIVQVPFAASGVTATVPSEADSLLRFAFDPASATAERAGADLLFTLDNGGAVVLADFFAVGDGALPAFVLPDGATVAAADFFNGSDLDLATAAGTASAAQGGSGAGEYAADAGDLINGLDRLGSLGTDYWGRLTDAPEEAGGLVADAGLTTAEATGPARPTDPLDPTKPIEVGEYYNARAVLYHTGPDATTSMEGVYLLQGPDSLAAIAGPDDFVASGFENNYFTYTLEGDGALTFTLTAAGLAALADAGTGNVYDYITFQVGDFTYTMQVVANQDGNFDSASEDGKTSGGKILDGSLLYGEWHSEAEGSGGGSRTTSQGHDTVLFDAGTEDGLIAVGAPVFSGTLHTGGGNDQVTAYGRVDGATITMGQGDDSFTVHGSIADSKVAMGQGSNTATIAFDAAAVSSLDPYAGGQAYAVKNSSITAGGDSTLSITALGQGQAGSVTGVRTDTGKSNLDMGAAGSAIIVTADSGVSGGAIGVHTGGNGVPGETVLNAETVHIAATGVSFAQGIKNVTSGSIAAATHITAGTVTISGECDDAFAAGLDARGRGAYVSISADDAVAISANKEAGRTAEATNDWSGLSSQAIALVALQYSEVHVAGNSVDLYAAGGRDAYAIHAFTNGGAPAADATYGAHIAGTDGNDTVTLTAHSVAKEAVGVYCLDVGRATFNGGASTAGADGLGDVLRITAHAHGSGIASGMISGGYADEDYIFESGHGTGSPGSVVVTRTEDVSITAISDRGSAYGMVTSGQSSFGNSHNTIKDADGALKVTVSAQGGGRYAGAMVANMAENIIQGGALADTISLSAEAADGIAMGMYAARGTSVCQGSNRLELGGGDNVVEISVSGKSAYGMYADNDTYGENASYNKISSGEGGSLNLTITADASDGEAYAMYAKGYGNKTGTNIISGGDGDDHITLTGSLGAGSGGKNIITTGEGDDELHITGNVQGATSIDMGADNDHLHITGNVLGGDFDMGDGNDVLILEGSFSGATITGGTGMDTLGLKGGGAYDLETLAQQVNGFEVIDFTNDTADTLVINGLLSGLGVDARLDKDAFTSGTPEDLVNALTEGAVLRVHGNGDDSVTLGDGWTASERSVTYEGQTYQVYQHEDSTDYLLIQNGIIV